MMNSLIKHSVIVLIHTRNQVTNMDQIGTIRKHSENLNILYVRHDEDICDTNTTLLFSLFASVVTATNAKEGYEKFLKHSIDVVICDIIVAKIEIVEMLRNIKLINKFQNIIIIASHKYSKNILKFTDIGITNFIFKPICLDRMYSALSIVIENINNSKFAQQMIISLEKELAHKSILLDQYREIVDVSTIVSKTDLKGYITHANDAFCKISGYTEKELIGKKHNIVKHPSQPPEVFRELWSTILAKKPWNGIIKNRRKDGSYYITSTSNRAIVDENGNIEEFISIRHDVTELYDLNEEIWRTQHEMLYLLGEVGETRSEETGNHVRRVAEYTKLLGQLYGLDREEVNYIYTASPMHDIGKVGIPDAILLKPGKLTENEYEVMKTHASIGFEMLKNSERPIIKTAAIIAHEHHENWDGSGYPRGLSKEEIHIYGRITALADVFDALSCDRVYKKAWPMEKVLDFLTAQREKQFDPILVDLFFDNIERFVQIKEKHR